jgi:hypothetical protein
VNHSTGAIDEVKEGNSPIHDDERLKREASSMGARSGSLNALPSSPGQTVIASGEGKTAQRVQENKDTNVNIGNGVTGALFQVGAKYDRSPRAGQIAALKNALTAMDGIAETMATDSLPRR